MNRGKGSRALFGWFVNENSSRHRRRIVVAVMYFSLAVTAFSSLAGPALGNTVGMWIWWLLGPAVGLGVPLTVLTFSALTFSTQNMATDYPNKLDERQRSVNYKAHYYSYHILCWVMLVAMTYLLVQFQVEGLWLPTTDNFIYLYISFTWVFVTLPTAVAAWTEPDPELERGF